MRTEIDGIRGLPLADRATALSTAHGILVRALDDDAALDELAPALQRAREEAAEPDSVEATRDAETTADQIAREGDA